MEDNQNIIKKIRGLLAIANDKKSNNDEESQSAFLLAQRLMLKNNINKSEVEDSMLEMEPIGEESVTIYKRLYWWEKDLAHIIAKNFRVKCYYQHKGSRHSSKIVFYGFGKDLELAKEMFILAYEVVLNHSKKYIDHYYLEYEFVYERTRYQTESIKASYIGGFLVGLERRFGEQVAILRESNELLVLIPKEVEESYKQMSENFGVVTTKRPNMEIAEAYTQGVNEAKKVDFTRSSIGSDYSSLKNKYILFAEGMTSDLFAKIIDVKDDCLSIVVMNAVTNAREQGKSIDFTTASFYHHVLNAEHNFEIVTENHEKSLFLEWYSAFRNAQTIFIKGHLGGNDLTTEDILDVQECIFEEEAAAAKYF